MKLDDFVAVSGLPGVFKINTSRNNGLVVEDLDTGKSKFCSVRKHQFTPLGTVAIYTLTDTIELKEVFAKMTALKETNPPVLPNDDKMKVQQYFETIIPDYDEDKVYVSDMKKVIKWFNFLDHRGLLVGSDEEE